MTVVYNGKFLVLLNIIYRQRETKVDKYRHTIDKREGISVKTVYEKYMLNVEKPQKL